MAEVIVGEVILSVSLVRANTFSMTSIAAALTWNGVLETLIADAENTSHSVPAVAPASVRQSLDVALRNVALRNVLLGRTVPHMALSPAYDPAPPPVRWVENAVSTK